MTSRGKRLVEMALKKTQYESGESCKTTDSNNNLLAAEEPQEPNNNNNTCELASRHSLKKDFPHIVYRIQGQSIQNVNELLYCHEQLNDISDVTSKECESNIDSAPVLLDTDDFFDSDDSLNDPDWKLETEKKRKHLTSTSSESDYESCKPTKKKKKVKRSTCAKPSSTSKSSETETQTDKDNISETSVNNVPILDAPAEYQECVTVDHEELIRNEQYENTPARKKAKKGMGNPDDWVVNVNKKLRMEGKTYKGIGKVAGKKTHCKERGERIQGERTCSKRCKLRRKCFEISDILRKEIFDAFWERMDWSEKKTYISTLVMKTESKNRASESRRNFTFKYFFRNGEEKIPVCKDLFLSTLGIGESIVYEWLKKCDEHGLPKERNIPRRVPEDSTEAKDAKEFLESLPKMPSHYCRSTSSSEYLEPIFTSFAELYKVYFGRCEERRQNPIGIKLFKKIFDKMNISLFRPKKDQCDICVGHETQNISEEDYTLHVRLKEDARAEKHRDKERALENLKVKAYTMDVQSVLLSPRIEASAMYYKTKLACHNFTVYDMVTKEVKCFFWHEGEGGLTANSFASCMYNFLESAIQTETEEFILYSDGCGYQNRNSTLSNALLMFAVKHKVTVTQNFLEKGHTQMEVDSVHSTIERAIRRKPIYSPANYVQIFKDARKTHPYQVQYLEHTFFRDYSSLKYYDTIRPGTKVGDPVVTDIRGLRYLKDGTIQYRLTYNSEYIDVPKRRNSLQPSDDDTVPPLYHAPLPIKRSKYEHLQQLKAVIPKDYHPFYDSLAWANGS